MIDIVKSEKIFNPRKEEIISLYKRGQISRDEAASTLTIAQGAAWLEATGRSRDFDYDKWFDLLPSY